MNNTWRWIIGIMVGLAVIGLLLVGRSERQAYRIARGAIEQRDQARQDQIDTAIQTAQASVDQALSISAGLPVQEEAAARINQGLEEVGSLLKDASDARGDAAVQLLDKATDLFNNLLKTVEDAANQATNPQVKSELDQIYSALFAAKQQITETVLDRHQK